MQMKAIYAIPRHGGLNWKAEENHSKDLCSWARVLTTMKRLEKQDQSEFP